MFYHNSARSWWSRFSEPSFLCFWVAAPKLSVIVLSNSSETEAEALAFETAEVFLAKPL
jgi:hypothetical protein